MRAAWLLVLPCAMLALALRLRPVLELSDANADLRAVALSPFDEPGSAQLLRQVELALASDRLPAFDRFLGHPQGREIVSLPVFPFALAVLADLALSERGGDPALGGVSEAHLEDLLVRVPPLLGALTTTVVFAAAWTLAHGRWRGAAAALAACTYAVLPAAVRADAAGRLDLNAWLGLLLALQVLLAVRAFRAVDALDRIQNGLLGGLVAGIALASSPLALLFLLGTWAGFLAASWATDEVRAHTARRAGLLFCLVATATSLLPSFEGPWELVPGGVVSRGVLGVGGTMLVLTASFFLGSLGPRRLRRHGRLAALGSVGLPFLGLLLPGVSDGLRAVFTELAPSDTAGLGRASWTADLFLLVPYLVAWALVVARWRLPERADLLVTGAALLALCAWNPRTAPLLAVPMACTLAVAVDGELERPGARPWLLPGLLVLALVASVVATFHEGHEGREGHSARVERVELVRALRWMRTGTPSPGAWNAPATVQDWGVLSAPSIAASIAYHARRPAIAVSEFPRVLLEEDVADLARQASVAGAAYVVVSPGMLREVQRLFGPARAEETALWQLARTPLDAAPDAHPGLERVWASEILVTPEGEPPQDGDPAGPAASIYRVLAGDPRASELHAR